MGEHFQHLLKEQQHLTSLLTLLEENDLFAMNKMLVLLFTIVSLSIGSSLAQDSESSTSPQCYAFDGCTDAKQSGGNGKPPGHGWKEGDLRPGFHDCATKMGAISCCAMDGSQCSRMLNGKCRSGKAGKDEEWKVTWNEAKEHCEADGMRLCETQAELDGCCRNGCQYDNALVWSNVNMVGDVLGGTSGVVPGVVPACMVFDDCPGKKSWCKNGVCT